MRSLLLASSLLVLLPACAGSYERQTRSSLDARPRPVPRDDDADPEAPSASFDGSYPRYVGYALEHNPDLRARYAEWEAAVDGIDTMRSLPNPVVRYSLYLRHVETRVGPQRHKLGFSQSFPWPTQLSAGAASASLSASAAEQRLDGEALAVTERVGSAYWRLWLVDRTKGVLEDQQKLLEAVEEAARARLEVGSASLADLTQVSLRRSRLIDRIGALTEERHRLEAALRRALSVTPATALPVAEAPPEVALPSESDASLRQAARKNPRVSALELLAESRREAADRAFAAGLPGFSVGVDWIETGPAMATGVADSGKDAVMLNFGIDIPIWRHVHSAEEARAKSESRAFLAQRDAAEDEMVAGTEVALADVRDAFRRVRLYRDTLLPQAETVIESVLGGYQVGEVGLAAVLMGQDDMLELSLGLHRAQADHAIAWARLEALVGRKVAAGEGA